MRAANDRFDAQRRIEIAHGGRDWTVVERGDVVGHYAEQEHALKAALARCASRFDEGAPAFVCFATA